MGVQSCAFLKQIASHRGSPGSICGLRGTLSARALERLRRSVDPLGLAAGISAPPSGEYAGRTAFRLWVVSEGSFTPSPSRGAMHRVSKNVEFRAHTCAAISPFCRGRAPVSSSEDPKARILCSLGLPSLLSKLSIVLMATSDAVERRSLRYSTRARVAGH